MSPEKPAIARNDMLAMCQWNAILNEKLATALHKDNNILNKRFEVISKRKHRNKYILANYGSRV